MIIVLFNQAVQGQERKGFEEYYYPANGWNAAFLSTRLFYQSGQGWYTECRYNYEVEGTAGFSVGKTFSKENAFSYSVTPEVGFAAGKIQGASVGLNTSLSFRRLSFTSSTLYTAGFEKEEAGYSLYDWSELNVRMTGYLYGGVTIQLLSSLYTAISPEPGVQLGVVLKGWTFAVYGLDRPGGHPHLSTCACYEWKK
jgi:hypothetical protein